MHLVSESVKKVKGVVIELQEKRGTWSRGWVCSWTRAGTTQKKVGSGFWVKFDGCLRFV